LHRAPLCEICLAKGISEPAVEVHHRQSLRNGGARLDPDNLQALCVRCHRIITAREARA